MPLADNSGGVFGGTSNHKLKVKKFWRSLALGWSKNLVAPVVASLFLQFLTFKVRKVQEIGILFQLSVQTLSKGVNRDHYQQRVQAMG